MQRIESKLLFREAKRDRVRFEFEDFAFLPTIRKRVIRARLPYTIGHLFTDKGKPIYSLKYLPDINHAVTITECDFIDIRGNPIGNLKEEIIKLSDLPPNVAVPKYNCHGLSFGDAQYGIFDGHAQIILMDDYVETVDASEANVIAFFEKGIAVHSAKITPEGFLSKSGVNGLHTYRLDEIPIPEYMAYDRIAHFKSNPI